MAPTTRRVPPILEPLLADMRESLCARFGNRLREMRLFGSFARGEAHADSDVDILIVIDSLQGSIERIAAIDEAVDAGLEHDLVVGPLVLSVDDLARHRRKETALARILAEEGITG